MRAWLWLGSWLVLGAGCGSTGEYVCPDPVGKIIRDDCEVYRSKYETLKVELGASVGPLGAKAVLSHKSLRDPTELLQILAHRTHALCRDFNSCRVPPLEYHQRREQTDRIFTAVSTIQEQLKGTLDTESKARLVRELVAILGQDSTVASSSTTTTGGTGGTSGTTSIRATVRRGGGDYKSWIPWFGTKLLPPQPSSPPSFPRLVDYHFDLTHVFRQESPYGILGYRPTVRLWLLGKTEADDLVTVDWGGTTSDCPIGRGEDNGLGRVRCEAPKALTLTGPSFTVQVTYRRGQDGKSAFVGRRTVTVLARHVEGTVAGSHSYALDHDPSARQGWLVLRPFGEGLSPDFERPSLFVVLKLRKHHKTTARCWANGNVATPGLEASRYSGQHGTFQDRPRYESTGPGSSRAVAEPFIEWWHYDFPLPFLARRGREALPEGSKAWPIAGDWRCVVSLEGEPVRELRFTVNGDGRLRPHSRQTLEPSAGWLVETKVVPHPLEMPLP